MSQTAKIEHLHITATESMEEIPFTDGEFVTAFERYLRRTSLGRKMPMPRWARW